MINNNDIDIKSIIALSGPHALQFGGAQQLRIVMARRAPEGGPGHKLSYDVDNGKSIYSTRSDTGWDGQLATAVDGNKEQTPAGGVVSVLGSERYALD